MDCSKSTIKVNKRKPIIRKPVIKLNRLERDEFLNCTQIIEKKYNKPGMYVEMFTTEKRSVIPHIAQIVHVYPNFILLRYRVYGTKLEFRQWVYTTVHLQAVYCGDITLDIIQ